MPITLSAINANGDEPIENDRGVIINYSLPVWTVNTNPDNGNGGSVWPALFSGQQARAALQLMVQVGNDWNGILFSVAGVLNGATLFQSGTVNLAPGPATISVGATFATPALFTAVGDVAWWVVPQQGAAVPLATTRLELIWIYGPMPGFFGNRNYPSSPLGRRGAVAGPERGREPDREYVLQRDQQILRHKVRQTGFRLHDHRG